MTSKKWYQFIDTCKKLKEYWIIDNKLKNKLSKLYRKYRNPAHHWLFKKLIDTINWEENCKIPVYCWGIDKPWINEVSSSNIILREWTDYLSSVSRRISIEIFYLINETINTLWDFN